MEHKILQVKWKRWNRYSFFTEDKLVGEWTYNLGLLIYDSGMGVVKGRKYKFIEILGEYKVLIKNDIGETIGSAYVGGPRPWLTGQVVFNYKSEQYTFQAGNFL